MVLGNTFHVTMGCIDLYWSKGDVTIRGNTLHVTIGCSDLYWPKGGVTILGITLHFTMGCSDLYSKHFIIEASKVGTRKGASTYKTICHRNINAMCWR